LAYPPSVTSFSVPSQCSMAATVPIKCQVGVGSQNESTRVTDTKADANKGNPRPGETGGLGGCRGERPTHLKLSASPTAAIGGRLVVMAKGLATCRSS
jgi:hypothetical protein